MGTSLSNQKKQELLQDIQFFQEWIKVLEHAVYSLAQTIDVMEDSAKVVVCHLDEMLLDKKGNNTAGGYSSDTTYQRTHVAANTLLGEIKDTVKYQKLFTLQTVSNFINRICPLLKEYGVSSSGKQFSPQKIDRYLTKKGSAIAHNSLADIASTLEFDTQYFSEDNTTKIDREAEVPKSSEDNHVYKNAVTTIRHQKSAEEREDKQVQTLDSDITETEEEKKLKLENMQLKQEKMEIESDSNMLKDEILKLSAELSDLRNELDGLNANKQLLQEELSTQKRIIEERDTQNQLLENKVKILTETNDAVDQQLQTLKNKKVLQVQLFCQPRGGLVSTVEEEFKLNLKKKYGDDNIKLKCIQCDKTTDIKPDIPLLVLCISASRLGTDVSNILQGLKLTSKVSVLVFHHKDVYALPSQASDRVLSGPEFEHIGGIFDMAFLSAKGMYSCEMNDKGFINILNFLDKEGTLTSDC